MLSFDKTAQEVVSRMQQALRAADTPRFENSLPGIKEICFQFSCADAIAKLSELKAPLSLSDDKDLRTSRLNGELRGCFSFRMCELRAPIDKLETVVKGLQDMIAKGVLDDPIINEKLGGPVHRSLVLDSLLPALKSVKGWSGGDESPMGRANIIEKLQDVSDQRIERDHDTVVTALKTACLAADLAILIEGARSQMGYGNAPLTLQGQFEQSKDRVAMRIDELTKRGASNGFGSIAEVILTYHSGAYSWLRESPALALSIYKRIQNLYESCPQGIGGIDSVLTNAAFRPNRD